MTQVMKNILFHVQKNFISEFPLELCVSNTSISAGKRWIHNGVQRALAGFSRRANAIDKQLQGHPCCWIAHDVQTQLINNYKGSGAAE